MNRRQIIAATAILVFLLFTSIPVHTQAQSSCDTVLPGIEKLWRQGDLLDALATADLALADIDERDSTCVAMLYNWRAVIHISLQELPSAVQDYHEALARWRQLLVTESAPERIYLGDPLDARLATAATANNLGLLLGRVGRFQEALTFLNESLATLTTPEPSAGGLQGTVESTSTSRRSRRGATPAATEGQRGQRLRPSSTPMPRTVMPDSAPLQDAFVQARTVPVLNNIGLIQLNLGEYAAAETSFDRALARAIDPEQRAEALNHKALVARGLGRYTRAHALLSQAEAELPAQNRIGGVIWSNRGATYAAQGKYDEAIAAYDEALNFQSVLPQVEPRQMLFQFSAGLGRARRVGDSGPARYETITIVSRSEDLAARATILHNIGNAYRLRGEEGDLAIALGFFDESLVLADQAGNINGMISTYHAIALTHEAAGDQALAATVYIQALAYLESLNALLTVPELQSSFNAKQMPIYANWIRLLIEAGEDEEAFTVGERARARAFLNQIGNHLADLSPNIPPTLAQREQTLRRQMIETQQALNAARTQLDADLAGIEALATQLEQLRQAYEALLTQIKLSNPEYAALLNVEVLDVHTVQTQILDDQTTLVEYFILDEEVLAWVIDRDRVELVRLDISQNQLTSDIHFLRNLLADNQVATAQTAARLHNRFSKLHDTLLAPLTRHIRHTNLIIVPHGVLHYLPFAALWDAETEQYLFENYTISYVPSASTLPFILDKRNPNAQRLLVLGNPDGSLPHAETEAEAIAQLYNTLPLVRNDATESQVYTRAEQLDVLHLAAHGVYDPFNPMFTRIELASDARHDGNLEVHEILGLPLTNTNLVVLSACNSDEGELNSGDELIGLTRAFLYAGAPSVVTTLWTIDDAASSVLMERFHREMREGSSMAEALQAAQQSVLETEEWSSPYYWAAFRLTGDASGSLEQQAD